MKVNIKTLLGFLLIPIALICFLAAGFDLIFTCVLIVWLFLFLYSCANIKDRSILFAFLVAFFVFLLGRDFVQQIFHYKKEIFDYSTQLHAYSLYIVSLITIGLFYFYFTIRYSRKYRIKEKKKEDYSYVASIQKISILTYCVSWIFAIVTKIMVGRFVATSGYSELYTEYSAYLSENTVLYLISKIELIMPVAWCIYLATMPTKAKMKWPTLLQIIYLIASLGSGQRSTAMLGLLFLFVYLEYRNGLEPDEKWITKKMIVLGALSLPLLAMFLSVFSLWRMGDDISDINYSTSILDFFYDQGVTGNVLKRAYMYQDIIPNQIYTLEFLHSGIFARLLNVKIYYGNSVDHALHGGSFAHSLGYTILGNSYLAGRGTGTCYIAELYYDFGYIGVVAGNIIYAYLFSKIANRRANSNIFQISIGLLVVNQLLWTPRGSFSGFVTQIMAPTTLLTYLLIFGLIQIWKNIQGNKIETIVSGGDNEC